MTSLAEIRSTLPAVLDAAGVTEAKGCIRRIQPGLPDNADVKIFSVTQADGRRGVMIAANKGVAAALYRQQPGWDVDPSRITEFSDVQSFSASLAPAAPPPPVPVVPPVVTPAEKPAAPPAASEPGEFRVLAKGHAGEDVKDVQHDLHAIGLYAYNGKQQLKEPPPDGRFGNRTEAGVRAFQKKYGITGKDGKASGQVGSQTEATLEAAAALNTFRAFKKGGLDEGERTNLAEGVSELVAAMKHIDNEKAARALTAIASKLATSLDAADVPDGSALATQLAALRTQIDRTHKPTK